MSDSESRSPAILGKLHFHSDIARAPSFVRLRLADVYGSLT